MKRVVLALADDQNPYQQLLAKKAQAAASMFGIELPPPRYADGLAMRQIEIFFECVRDDPRPDAILTALVSVEGMQKAIEMIAKAGIDCVFLNRVPEFLEQFRSDFPKMLLASVSPDQVEIGRIQGRQCLKLLPDGGFVLHVLGSQGTPSATIRQRGFREIVEGRVEVHEIDGYWTSDRARMALNAWFRLGSDRGRTIDLIVCQNDPMARGARAALQEQAARQAESGLLATPIIGCDGLPEEGQRMVLARELIATVVMPPTTTRAIEILHAYWEQGVRVTDETLLPSLFPPIEQIEDRETRSAGGVKRDQ